MIAERLHGVVGGIEFRIGLAREAGGDGMMHQQVGITADGVEGRSGVGPQVRDCR